MKNNEVTITAHGIDHTGFLLWYWCTRICKLDGGGDRNTNSHTLESNEDFIFKSNDLSNIRQTQEI